MKAMGRFAIALILGLTFSSGLSIGQNRAVTAVSKKTGAIQTAALSATREISQQLADKLPIRRVVLYKNGIGYFEHLGTVHATQDVLIDFTSAQLNDVLNSLTVLDLGGGRITGVDYNSEAPLDRRLSTLRLALGQHPNISEFLGALRGARIEVRSGSSPGISGRLLSIERKTRSSPNWTVETDEISLITDSGETHIVDLNPTTTIRILDRDLIVEVGRYMNLIASSRDQDVRRMTISTMGTGDRNLYVSYISEVPIWKTTYRIVLPSKQDRKPLLQGWAIVDNTVGEDWNNVELSLVAGAPHSFIQQLSEPYYGRRAVLPLPGSVQLSPQTHSATLADGNGRLSGVVSDSTGAVIPATNLRLLDEHNNVISQTTTDSAGRYEFSSLALGNYHLEARKEGFNTTVIAPVHVAPGENNVNASLNVGSVSQTVEVTAEAPSSPPETSLSTLVGTPTTPPVARRAHIDIGSGSAAFSPPPPTSLNEARETMEAAASGQDLGDLFEYKLKDRVTLKKNQSALVPIVQSDIEVENVSLWRSTSGSGHPLRALWVKNTSPLTLDGGSFTVLENEVFAGEGLMDAIKPGERRLLSYATDLALLVEAQSTNRAQHATRVKIAHAVMTQVSELQERTLYTVRNQDTAPRTLIVEHPERSGWSLVKGADEPEERTVGAYRFRVNIAGHATSTLPVEEVRALETTYQVSHIDENQIALFVQQKSITPQMEQALKKIVAQRAIVAKLEDVMEARQKDTDLIGGDQQRIRENLKALKGSPEEKALIQRYTRQLDRQETQLEQLRQQIQDTETQRDKANDELEKMIEDLQIEATL